MVNWTGIPPPAAKGHEVLSERKQRQPQGSRTLWENRGTPGRGTFMKTLDWQKDEPGLGEMEMSDLKA